MKDTWQLLTFINSQNSEIQLEQILLIEPHPNLKMRGWVGICLLVGMSATKIYDVDVRWANSPTIFRQELFDFAWTEDLLLVGRQRDRHKLIIYLCDPVMTMMRKGSHLLPEHFLIGKVWQSITHIYTHAPHPFEIPIELSPPIENYATTTNLTGKVPRVDRTFPSMLLSTGQMQGGLRTQGLFKKADTDLLLISIITVVYNGEKYIEQTIQSVINQSYENLEYIIVDGGSTDQTLEIICKYDDYINYWVSAPDHGIYSAMNKGTQLATGSHILHLNADDLLFEPCSLDFLDLANYTDNHMRSILKVNLDTDKVEKDLVSIIGNSLVENVIYSDPFLQVSRTMMGHAGFVGKINDSLVFNEDYQVSSDTVMLIHKFKTESVRLSTQVLSIFRSGGASSDNKIILAEMWQEIIKQPGLWQKIAVWLQLQGVFAVWK
jgi:Glycosyl transferase family 2